MLFLSDMLDMALFILVATIYILLVVLGISVMWDASIGAALKLPHLEYDQAFCLYVLFRLLCATVPVPIVRELKRKEEDSIDL